MHSGICKSYKMLGVINRTIVYKTTDSGGVFLLRQSALTDLARCVCHSFIRLSVSFLVF